MPVVEFCEFTPSKSYANDNNIIDPALKAIAKHAGVLRYIFLCAHDVDILM